MTEEEEVNSMTEEEEAKYNLEQDIIDSLFPDVGYEIGISLDELDEIISIHDHIVIKNTYNCYCYNDEPKNTDYIDVRKIGGNITIRDVLNKFNQIKFCSDCNHRFIEDIYPCNSGDTLSTQFEMFIGS